MYYAHFLKQGFRAHPPQIHNSLTFMSVVSIAIYNPEIKIVNTV